MRSVERNTVLFKNSLWLKILAAASAQHTGEPERSVCARSILSGGGGSQHNNAVPAGFHERGGRGDGSDSTVTTAHCHRTGRILPRCGER